MFGNFVGKVSETCLIKLMVLGVRYLYSIGKVLIRYWEGVSVWYW